MHRTRIKICGVRDAETAAAAAEAGADAIGFVFVESSPRYIDPDEATQIMFGLSPFVSAVGVVQDLDVDAFAEIEQRCPAQLMQLHGDESDQTVAACGPGVIKAIRFDPADPVGQLRRWSRLAEVDAILVDGPNPGSGEAIDWSALAAAQREVAVPKPLILAGGLTPENVGEAIRAVRPFAVDVSSGVERSRGEKAPELIRAFCDAVRHADADA